MWIIMPLKQNFYLMIFYLSILIKVYKFKRDGRSFKGSVGWTFCCSHTGLTVLGWLVGDWEFTQISANHVEFDLDVVKCFSVIDGNIVSNHLWEDDCITEVSFNWSRLLSRLCVLLALFTFSVEPNVFMFYFCINDNLLLENLLLILALNNSTTFSWDNSLIWSGVYPLKLCLLIPFSFLGAVLMW